MAYTQNEMLNRGYAYASTIQSNHQGQTLLSHLASLYPHSTVETWQERLNAGEITLDGARAGGSEVVTAGQALLWKRPPWVEVDVPRRYEVVFEDPHLVAVDKPAGLPTLPGGGFLENTLLHCVRREFAGAIPVHRLGRFTSGVVLFARTARMAAAVCADWNTPRTRKIYRAVAQGVAVEDAYEIATPIGLVPHPHIGSVWAAHPQGKPSRSWARVIGRAANATEFEVSLGSGRPHQIRIHLASIGHPLAGDRLYGPGGLPLEELAALPGDGGYLLHAEILEFRHPVSRERTSVEAALPCGFRV